MRPCLSAVNISLMWTIIIITVGNNDTSMLQQNYIITLLTIKFDWISRTLYLWHQVDPWSSEHWSTQWVSLNPLSYISPKRHCIPCWFSPRQKIASENQTAKVIHFIKLISSSITVFCVIKLCAIYPLTSFLWIFSRRVFVRKGKMEHDGCRPRHPAPFTL